MHVRVVRPSLATLALACIGGFAGLLVALHIFAAQVYDMPAYISQFVARPHGYLFPVGMVLFIAGITAIAITLRRQLVPSRHAKVALGLFGLVVVLAAVVATFPTDPGTTLSVIGIIHAAAAIPTFLFLAALMYVLGWAFRHDPRWRSLAPVSMGLGIAVTVVLVGVAIGFGWSKEVAGIFQRVAAFLDGVWLTMIAMRARRIAVTGHGAKAAKRVTRKAG